MKGFLTFTGVFLLSLMGVSFWRILRGPTVYDRIVAANFVGTLVLVLVLVCGVLYERLDAFIDIALLYSLLSFIGVLVLAKYLAQRG